MHALPLVCLCVLIRTGAAAAARRPELIKVEQDSDAMLPCSLGNKQNMESGLFHWKKASDGDQLPKEVFFYEAPSSHYNNGLDGQSDQFKGRVAFFPDELKHGNASIVIRNTKMADAGNYTCAFPRLQTPQTFYVELIVGPVLTS
ncbi:CD276 antigen homolog [Clinocottus analis]|uniref:CD276 antigen homolog n=1 Tax=Clinocottus analis TaxID=304258 RepID=UPI0035C0A216